MPFQNRWSPHPPSHHLQLACVHVPSSLRARNNSLGDGLPYVGKFCSTYYSSALWSSKQWYRRTTACNCFPLHCCSIALRSSKRRRHAIARSGRPADGSLPWQQRFLALPDFSHFGTTINFSTLAAFCGLICPLAWPPSQNQRLTKKRNKHQHL